MDKYSFDLRSEPKMVSILPDTINAGISYESYKVLVIITGIIVIIILFGMMFGGWYASNQLQIVTNKNKYNVDAYKRAVRKASSQSDHGKSKNGEFNHIDNGNDYPDSISCESSPHRTWEKGQCLCQPPYWGKQCQRETYGVNYFSVGSFTPYGNLDIIEEREVGNKSFPFEGLGETCEDRCTDNTDCIGFIFTELGNKPPKGNGNLCTLLRSTPGGEVHYNPDIDGNLYLHRERSIHRPLFPQKVILHQSLLPRFWITERSSEKGSSHANIRYNHVNRLKFYPSGVINDGNATIVFSREHFTQAKAEKIAEDFRVGRKIPDNFYVYIPGINTFHLPHEWIEGEGYWVIAIPGKEEVIPINGHCTDSVGSKTLSRPSGTRSETLFIDDFDGSASFDKTLTGDNTLIDAWTD